MGLTWLLVMWKSRLGKLEVGSELSEGGMPLPVVGSFGPLWNRSSRSLIPGEGRLYSCKPATALYTLDMSGVLVYLPTEVPRRDILVQVLQEHKMVYVD